MRPERRSPPRQVVARRIVVRAPVVGANHRHD